ncbi:MAG: hypothetical protein AB1752_11390 [Candidatus Zixiibacteriota bacterium]
MSQSDADENVTRDRLGTDTGVVGRSLSLPYIVFAVVVLYAWYFARLRYALNAEFPLATLQALADGTAYKPFQFRALVPWIAGWVSSMGLCDLKTAYMAIEGVSVVWLFYALRYLLRDYASGWAREGLPFLGLYALPWNYILPRDIPIIVPSDIVAVALFTLGLALLRERRWVWFYPVFLIGTLNRETMIFLLIIFVLVEWQRMAKRQLAVHAGIMIILWGGVKVLMNALYGGNPGETIEIYHVGSQVTHLSTNLEMLVSPARLLVILSSFGFLWVPVLFFYRRIPDRFARRALWVVPLYVIMIILIGNMNEVRVWGEMLALVVLGLLAGFSSTGVDQSA